MILSRTAIYSLRALAVLAHLGPGESITGKDLSERTGVPREYLTKVMRLLARRKILRAQRGKGGGFSLQRPAAQIPLAEVLEAVETRLELGQCAFQSGRCDIQAPCVLHGAWSRLQESVGNWAIETTVADLGPRGQSGPGAAATPLPGRLRS